MHTSRTDVDLMAAAEASRAASAVRCSCRGGSFTPGSERRRRGGGEGGHERGDLRKHHSAEGDKWSLKPAEYTEYDLRKHLSDDSRMHERERMQQRSTLQVPEVHANPKQRCTCPRLPRTLSLTPSPSPSGGGGDSSRRPSPMLVCRSSLTPELPPMRRRGGGESMRKKSVSPVSPVQQPEPAEQEQQEPLAPSPKQASIEQQQQQQQQTKKMSKKERLAQQQLQLGEAKRAIRSKWAMKPHFSLPAEPRKEGGSAAGKWAEMKEGKSKSLKERPKYSVRRSMSPEPDQILLRSTDNRVVRRLISAEVQLPPQDGGAKWAPYEGYSPLPAVGMKKGRHRESKKISDIQWEPRPHDDESPIRGGVLTPRPKLADLRVVMTGDRGDDDDEDVAAADGPEDFHKITPPHAPPPEATPPGAAASEDEKFRMRMLNQVSCFPIYQGAWREESPPPTPPPPDLSTPIWSPKDASTVTAAQLREQSIAAARHSPSPSASSLPASPPTPPPPQRKRSTAAAALKGRTIRSSSSKKDRAAARAKSQDSTRQRQQWRKQSQQAEIEQLRSILSRGGGAAMTDRPAAAEEADGRRSRPQLLRSKAFALELPHTAEQLAKRSLSEEVRSYNPRSESTRRGLFSRAKSEDASRSRRPWSPDDDDTADELREYVTTV